MPRRFGVSPSIHGASGVAWGIAEPASAARTERGIVVVDAGAPAATIAAAWDRWGLELPHHLEGEFAVVVVEAGRVVAMRDAFGARPLFAWVDGGRVVLASEVGALLAAGAPRELEPGTVAAYLLQDWHTAPEATFFRSVRRVPPGAVATIGPDFVWERWWRPPAVDPGLGDAREAARSFREALLRATSEQLAGEDRAVMQLSGGLDSAGVVVGADHLRRRGEVTAELSAISAVFPGTPADESRYVDAVCGRVRMPCERYDATISGPRDELPFDASHPWVEVGHAIPAGWKAAARRRGARVVMSGYGGDELLFEAGLFLDLAADRRVRALLAETALATRYSAGGWAHHLDVPLRHLLPGPVRALFRALRPRRDREPPPWAGPRIREAPPPPDLPLDVDERPHLRRVTWAGLVSPGRAWIQEILAADAARSGLELRSPYLDRRVAEAVLAVPYQARLPGGRMKALLRDGLADLLPPEVRERRGVTGFDTIFVAAARAQEPLMRAAIEAGPWASEGWVDRPAARALLDRARRSASIDLWLSVWGLATFELWLRRQ